MVLAADYYYCMYYYHHYSLTLFVLSAVFLLWFSARRSLPTTLLSSRSFSYTNIRPSFISSIQTLPVHRLFVSFNNDRVAYSDDTMLFTKSAVPLAVLALCNVVVAAQPPACLLSVMGDQPNPADLKTICVKNADKVQDALSKECDDSKGEALKHFANTCSLNGYKVDSSSTSDSTASATTAGSHSTMTGFSSTTTAKNAESTSGSGSGSSSSASSTSNSTSSSPSASSPVSAGASDRHVSAAAFAAVVFVGFAATM